MIPLFALMAGAYIFARMVHQIVGGSDHEAAAALRIMSAFLAIAVAVVCIVMIFDAADTVTQAVGR